MKKLISSFLIVVCVAVLGCSSTVKINSQPSGADIYVDGELRGKTPYTMTDKKPFWAVSQVKIVHPGYKTLENNLEKDRLNVFNTVAGFCLFIPWAWVMDYPDEKLYTLEAEK